MTPFQPSLNALRSALALILLAASALGAAAEGPAGEWPAYAADLASSKYSPLDQINRENLSQLKIAWRWKSIDGPHAEEVRKKYNRAHVSNLKATPLMVGGVLYITTPLYQAAAIDAVTGEQIWAHDPDSWRAAMPAMSLGFNGRGGAYWSDGKDARFLWGTGDGWLIAVDAKTGVPCETFGEKGRVDLTTGIREAERGKIDRKGRHMWSVASPPTICRGVVIVPCSISDDPMNKEMPPGNIRGYDVHTGKMLWNFNTVPQAGELGAETWEGDSWKYSGNTNVWTQISADEELGYFYLPTGTPTNDFYGGHRHGDNLFAESLICLEAKTGRRVWHYQLVHHGLWDYDPPCAPNLIEITVAGKKIKAVAQVMKNGHIFTFDRATGEPVWPIEERPVPDTDIPGEKVSPTQPFPTKPPSFESQGVAIDDLIDFTPELRAEALEIVKHYRIGPLFTPPSLATEGEDGMKGTIMNPGWGGGANWTGAGFDPETGLLYIPSSQGPIAPVLTKPAPGEGNMNYVRLSIPGVRGPQGLPLLKPPYSRVTAIDMNKGEIAWQVPHGGTSAKVRDHPALKGVTLPPLGTGGKSGPLVTKTLLFVGKRGEPGSKDPADAPALIAYDKATGAVAGEIPLPASAISAPMTYLLNGKQYLAVTVLASPPELVALALP